MGDIIYLSYYDLRIIVLKPIKAEHPVDKFTGSIYAIH